MTAQVLAAAPARVDLRLYAGNDFTFTLNVTGPDGAPFNLTGYHVLAQVRDAAAGTLYATFTTSVATSVVTLALTGAQTAAILAPSRWDVTVTDTGGRVTTIAAGDVTVTPAVSA